ncbi:MAG: hypothetical protein GY821_07515, partial [Gammaproteobacteria bacterium]|nr:hypothetical protein [Gammaproteobacteria bacterium]
MAIYYFHSTLRKREGKQPFLSTVAHHAGEAITDQQTQKVYGVGQSSQHIQSTVLLPSECGEMERSTLWNAVAAIDVDRQTA